MKTKINIKSESFCLDANSQKTINTISRDNRRVVINRVACFSLFFSLIGNSLSTIPSRHLEENNPVPISTSNIVVETSEPNIIIEEKKDLTYDIYKFIDKEGLSFDGFIKLLDSMTLDSGPFGKLYSDRESAIEALLNEDKSSEVKFLIIMARDGNTYDELDYMCAGITGEATGDGNCYDDAYAVASTLINRSHSAWYVNNYGQNFYTLFKAPGQYEIEISGNYLKYLGAIELPGYQAAIDALYTRESIHKWIQFRAHWVELNCTYEVFVTGGNKFLDKMKESDYVPYPDETVELSDVKKFLLSSINC